MVHGAFFSDRQRTAPHSLQYFIVFGRALALPCRAGVPRVVSCHFRRTALEEADREESGLGPRVERTVRKKRMVRGEGERENERMKREG